eukprot:3314880-Alexandrium_andersonii.AAC.1
MQLEGPLHASPLVPTPMPAPSSGNMVPDINDIDPMGDMDVDSDDDLAPVRPPGLVRAGGLPQARVAALQAP